MDAFGFDGLHLATVDFVDPETGPTEDIVAADADGQLGHLFVLVGFCTVEVGLEHGEEGFVLLVAIGGHELDADFWFFSFFQRHFGFGQSLTPAT